MKASYAKRSLRKKKQCTSASGKNDDNVDNRSSTDSPVQFPFSCNFRYKTVQFCLVFVHPHTHKQLPIVFSLFLYKRLLFEHPLEMHSARRHIKEKQNFMYGETSLLLSQKLSIDLTFEIYFTSIRSCSYVCIRLYYFVSS